MSSTAWRPRAIPAARHGQQTAGSGRSQRHQRRRERRAVRAPRSRLQASVRPRRRESSKRSSASVGLGAPIRGLAQVRTSRSAARPKPLEPRGSTSEPRAPTRRKAQVAYRLHAAARSGDRARPARARIWANPIVRRGAERGRPRRALRRQCDHAPRVIEMTKGIVRRCDRRHLPVGGGERLARRSTRLLLQHPSGHANARRDMAAPGVEE